MLKFVWIGEVVWNKRVEKAWVSEIGLGMNDRIIAKPIFGST